MTTVAQTNHETHGSHEAPSAFVGFVDFVVRPGGGDA
jgi:hypothetical protein